MAITLRHARVERAGSRRGYFCLTAAFALTACGIAPDVDTNSANTQLPKGIRTEAIACVRGDGPLRPECTVDQAVTEDGPVLTLRHPDGAFRRLLVTRDGRGVIAADGAQVATVTVSGPNRIAVAIGGDRYELPATVKGTAPAVQ